MRGWSSVAKEWETELKLHFLDEDRWNEVFTSSVIARLAVSPPAVDQLEAKYFDTDSNSLQKAGLAYRIRKEKGQWVATVKGNGSGDGGLHQRQEWNVLIEAPLATGEYFQGTSVGKPLSEAIGQEELKPQYTTRFERQYVELRTEDGSLIELAADRGEIVVGEKKELIREIELELKEGNPTAILAVGAEIADVFS
jgi:inorganic triphosphatase YgiF